MVRLYIMVHPNSWEVFNLHCYTERQNFAYLCCFSSSYDVLEVRLAPRLRHCRRRACQGPALLDREAKSKTLRSMMVCFVLSLCAVIIYVVVYSSFFFSQ